MNYSSLQILVTQLNNSFAYPVLVYILAFVMSLHVMILVATVVVGHKTGVVAHVLMLIVQTGMLFIYFAAVYLVALESDNLRLAAREKRENVRSRYERMQLKSVPPVECAIGHFITVNQLTVFSILDIVINTTVDIVIGISER